MSGQHAVLSPSDSARWIACPGSIALDAARPEVGDDSSPYAEEGTCAHALGEIKASLRFGKVDRDVYLSMIESWEQTWPQYADDPCCRAAMEQHTDTYVDLLADILKDTADGAIQLEQRVFTGVPESWGTADAVIVSPTSVHIVDLKYGAGVRVDATENSQLRLYGCGALDLFGDVLGETETVTMTVCQPRIGDGHAHSETLTAGELREWRDSVIPIAEEALAGSDRFGPSEKACRWCRHSGQCQAQMDEVFKDDFDEPSAMTPEQIADALERLPLVQVWVKSVQDVALTTAYGGVQIPGWKVVRSSGQRHIKGEAADQAVDSLLGLGYAPQDVTTTKIRGIGELEALLGKAGFADVLGPFVTKSQGRESLVRESDPRPPVDANAAAAEAFR